MGPRFAALALAASSLAALSACTVGPDYTRPVAKAPPQWAERPEAPSTTIGGEVDGRWWETFQDPQLSALVERLLAQNLDLAVAAERIQQAQAQSRVTGAQGSPQLGAQASYARTRRSPQGLFSQLMPAPGSSPEVNEFADALGASWELDLFGKVRRAVEAADARTGAVIEVRHAVALDAVGALAGHYMELRGVQAREAIAQDNLETAQRTLTVVEDRFANGLGTRLDVARARGQVEAISARLPELHSRRVQLINALGTLLAKPPRELEAELAPVRALPGVPPSVPVGLPGDLMRRRPDIREAEQRLHAATAETGVAVADFYPSISLGGRFGTEGFHAKNIGEWASRAFSVGPVISLPIFQGGRLKGTLELRKSEQREAALVYQKAVVEALNDVDNALVSYADIQAQRDRLAHEVGQDRTALAAARDMYREGAVGLLDVTLAQATLLEGEDRLALSETAVRGGLVRLYKALGGGWEAADAAPHNTLTKEAE